MLCSMQVLCLLKRNVFGSKLSTFIFVLCYLDERKMDFVLQELERNRQMVNQIAYKTFAASGINGSIFPAGPEVCFHLIMDMNFMMIFRCKIGLF